MTTDVGVAFEDLRRRAAELAAIGQRARGAALLEAAGDHAGASELLERACDFVGAARQALAAEDPARAALMAALGGDEVLAREALDLLVASAPRDAALRVAADLAARGFARHAGALFAALGAHAAAAEAFTAAHDARRAAESFELAGRPADGARVLEAALRRRPDDAAAWLALGELLARHGRTEAAVRALQRLPTDAPERARALPLLSRCLSELGLEDAARTVREELAELAPQGPGAPPPRDVAPGAPAPGAPAPGDRAPGDPAAGPLPAGPLLFGRYETLREVTATPHARVVEARDRITAERVAVKIFAGAAFGAGRDALLRFEREARALAQLRHPNVVALRAYHPEGPAMVLAWMAGGSLVDRLRGEPVAPARAVEIACALLSALGEAHRLGILHRDVKPSNVLFDEVGTAHLADFGAAHLGDLSTTATAGAIGTFAYMSPEQRMGRPATLASDLYGVGAVLAELLTGEPPAPAVGGLLDPAPSEAHPDLTAAHDAVVAALLAEAPAARPADAFQARRALTALSWPERARPQRSRASARPRSSEAPPATAARLAATLEVGDGRDTEGRWRDAWLDRDVLVLQLDEAALARARAFARAGHAALPCVLRVDLAAEEIWVALPLGRALADEGRALTRGQRARLAEAIAALHAAGGAHGCIDGQHLYLHDGEVTLAYPREAPGDVEEAVARDLAALRELDRDALDEL
ncbi:protein kinase domain-containing protein [Sorangium sp. So ce1097]|uniref:protein kinase domain-containing protein n=1 Tax=Sorangium sp. So ce1097 TaxID=3133330 RepID=UPI003F6005E6